MHIAKTLLISLSLFLSVSLWLTLNEYDRECLTQFAFD
jgi:hypothetical protein